MFKNLIVLLFCLGLGGCASFQYDVIYKSALKAKTSMTITKEENFQELQERITGYLMSQGYQKIIFKDVKERMIVFAKEGDFEIPCQIILKFTLKAGSDKIRVDIVNGSTDDLIAKDQVSEDIQKIADQLKNH